MDATFDHRSQDSGNVSWLVETDDGTGFVKTAGLTWSISTAPWPRPVGWPATCTTAACSWTSRPGATRFMAPEEFELGATIDERTTVYTLTRIAWHFGTRLTEDPSQFCGLRAVATTLEHAPHKDPDQRFDDVASFAHAWDTAQPRYPSQLTVRFLSVLRGRVG